MADMTSSSSSTPTQNPAARSSTWTPPAGWDGGWKGSMGKMDKYNVKLDTHLARTTTVILNPDRESRRTLNALDLCGPPRVKSDGELDQKPKQKPTEHQKNAIKNKLLGREWETKFFAVVISSEWDTTLRQYA